MNEQAKTMTMARYLARKAIKEEWRAQRKHWLWVEHSELVRAADAYVAEHQAELIEKAKTWLCKS